MRVLQSFPTRRSSDLGCSSTCTVETGYGCTGGTTTTKDTCTETCGDSKHMGTALTLCDDRNTGINDSHSSTWEIEAGYYCTGGTTSTKDTCTTTCGDG